MATVESKEKNLPAYVPYGTFKNFVTGFKTDGIPARVDKSTMSSLAGGTQSHLTSALKFLCLVGPQGEPQPGLELLVKSAETPTWHAAVAAVISTAYGHVIGNLDIKRASAGQLTEAFRNVGLEGATLDKALRFYLQGIKEAKIEHSPQIASMTPKNATPSKRPRGQNQNGQDDEPLDPAAGTTSNNHQDEAGMISFPIYIKGKKTGRILVPEDITLDECKMIDLAKQCVEQYAG